jgi:hypothetical protein
MSANLVENQPPEDAVGISTSLVHLVSQYRRMKGEVEMLFPALTQPGLQVLGAALAPMNARITASLWFDRRDLTATATATGAVNLARDCFR